ncbi:MAG: hypothetical protein RL375_921, partial [Pseudomonadota bacterium]
MTDATVVPTTLDPRAIQILSHVT